MKKCTYCGKELPDDATACPLDGEPLKVVSPPLTPAEKGVEAVSAKIWSARISLKLAVIVQFFWLVPMVAGDKVFHSGNQGFAELVPLAGLPLGIIAMYYAVKGIKGSKPGIAVAGLVLSIIAIMLCFAVVVAMPGPMQPLLGM